MKVYLFSICGLPLRCPQLSCVDTPFWRCDDYEDLRPCWWGRGPGVCVNLPNVALGHRWTWSTIRKGVRIQILFKVSAPPSPRRGGGTPDPWEGGLRPGGCLPDPPDLKKEPRWNNWVV